MFSSNYFVRPADIKKQVAAQLPGR